MCVLKTMLYKYLGRTQELTLVADGDIFLNNSHIILKRTSSETGDGEEVLHGVFAANGSSSFNSTHIVKKDDVSNETTAIVAVSSTVCD